ncbi:MAG: glycosyltransferase [Anaerolineae bacterium]
MALHSVSVVIPTYQRRDAVERALHCLARQTFPPDRYEVIVAVDGSRDGTREMVEAFEAPYRLRALWQENRGRAAACNLGIRAASGDLLVLLDDDMQPQPEFLAAHLAEHAADAALGVMGAAPIRWDASSPPALQYAGARFNRHLARLSEPGHRLQLRDFYSGNFSIRRSVLLDVDGFNPAFTIYGNEDIELSIRLRKLGVIFRYSPRALAFQSQMKDFGGLARDAIAKGKTSILLANMHPEVVPDLKLSSYRRGSPIWRMLRGGLLLASRVRPETLDAVIGGVKWLDRWPSPSQRAYDLALDYCYWHGVQTAQGRPATRGGDEAARPRAPRETEA